MKVNKCLANVCSVLLSESWNEVHMKIEPAEVAADCSMVVSEFTNLRPLHETNHSTSYHCTDCDRRYKRKKSLNRHLRYECGGEPKFCCSICHRSFSRNDTLKSHKRLVHKV